MLRSQRSTSQTLPKKFLGPRHNNNKTMIAFNSQPKDLEKSPDIILWRYMCIEELWDILKYRQIRLRQINTFDDHYEGIYLKYLLHQIPLNRNDITDKFNFYKNQCSAKCFFKSPNESAAMWDLYAKSGVAIQTTAEALIDNIGGLHRNNLSQSVKCIDYKSEINDVFDEISNLTLEDIENNLDNLFCYKLADFSQENEVRIISSITLDESVQRIDLTRNAAIRSLLENNIQITEEFLSHFNNEMAFHTNLSIRSLNNFIKRIVISPNAKRNTFSMLNDIIRSINLQNETDDIEILNIAIENSARTKWLHYEDIDFFD